MALVGIACVQAACGTTYHVAPLITLLSNNGIAVKVRQLLTSNVMLAM